MRSTRGGILAFVVAAAMALQSAPASAQTGTVTDPNDVRGKLDLASLHFEKASAKSPLVIVLKTYETWRKAVLRDHVNRLLVSLDVDKDGRPDFHARIKEIGGRLWVHIAGSGESFENLPAKKPDARTVRFKIPGSTS